ncbi:MAG: Glycerol-3-phosphate acyltransferase [Candidatus Berkelbacteria bacterium]|nr:Glycerol-3-phosphate acyltransferase [Candidatus Berkelbacteria bacterium]
MSNDKECSRCGSLINDDAEDCKFCKAKISLASKEVENEVGQPKKRDQGNKGQSIMTKQISSGVLVMIGGIVAVIYFAMFFDTSVVTPTTQMFGQTLGGDRVNNLGLMNDRSNGIMIGIGAAIFGLILSIVTKSKSKE